MRRTIIMLGVVTVVLSSLIWLASSYPSVAAAACPSCYGLADLGGGIYSERNSSAADKARIRATIAAARDRVRTFYKEMNAQPRILICQSEACYQAIGGGQSSGMAILDMALLLSPRGDNPVIAAHELAHIELHTRLGKMKTMERVIPQWFDEGLAVLISDDPRYLAPQTATNRCLVDSFERLPTDRASWVVSARRKDLYAKAACRVWTWVSENGGPSSISKLIGDVAQGGDFDILVPSR
jgi:hypothetical protein